MDEIKKALLEGNVDLAMELLAQKIAQEPTNDELFYLMGNAYRKQGDFQKALGSYLHAADLNPNSPAKEASNSLFEIMNFYNREAYNP